MPTTAWRFASTEGADGAVLKLKGLEAQDLIDVQDVTVLRWPHYAGGPAVQEHVTDQGTMVSSLMRKMKRETIDGSMIETVKTDLMPGHFGGGRAEFRRGDRRGSQGVRGRRDGADPYRPVRAGAGSAQGDDQAGSAESLAYTT